MRPFPTRALWIDLVERGRLVLLRLTRKHGLFHSSHSALPTFSVQLSRNQIKASLPLALSSCCRIVSVPSLWSSIFVCGCPDIAMATAIYRLIVFNCGFRKKKISEKFSGSGLIKLRGAAQIVRHRADEIWRNLIIKIGQLGLITKLHGIRALILHFEIHKDYGYIRPVVGILQLVTDISHLWLKFLLIISQSITFDSWHKRTRPLDGQLFNEICI